MKKPKVLVLSSVALNVGPAKTAEDYYFALNKFGIECDLMLLEEDENHPEYLYIRKKRTLEDLTKLDKMYNKYGSRKTPFFYKFEWNPMIPSKDVVVAIEKKYDIVIVVFWQEAFTFKTMNAIYNKLHCQFVWICVDYSTMSGGCHFVGDCERYKVGCGKCPAFYSDHWYDFTRINSYYRKWAIKQLKPIIVVNDFMKEFYDQSYLWKDYDRVEILKSAIINTDIFAPLDKTICKETFGITHHKKVILFGCQNITDPRKGITYLLDSIKILKEKLNSSEASQITVVGIGRSSEQISENIGFDYVALPYVEMNKLPEIYSLADCFVCPSINDAGPMMVNQALCCGTPVVGFDMGAVKSVVKGYGTGYCAKLKDIEDLAKGILTILNLPQEEYQVMCTRCREVALETSSYHAFANLIKRISTKYQ